MTPDENIKYLQSLQPGEKVIETERSSCMFGKTGVVYISENPGPTFGSKCVKWEDGMGTSVTHGTRRIPDQENPMHIDPFNTPFDIEFMGSKYNVILRQQHYQNDRLAIEIIDREDGAPFGMLTVNVPEAELGEDEIIVKTWSENEELAPQILKTLPAFFEDTGRKVPTGHVQASVWKLL